MTGKQNLTWRDVRVGIFVLVGFSFMLFIVMVVGTNTRQFTSKYTLHTFVPNVLSLNPGAYITIGGIKAGTIGEFQFTERNSVYGVQVSLFVENEFQDKVTESSIATIKTLGILGDKFVEISLGNADERVLQDGDFIPATEPFDYETLLPRVEEAANAIPRVLGAVNELLQRMQTGPGTFATILNDSATAKNVAKSLEELAQLTEALNQSQGSFGKLLHRDELYNNLESVTKRLDAVLAKTESGEGTLGKLVNDSTLYYHLANASGSADSLLNFANRGEGNIGKLFKDDKLYKRLDEILVELNLILEDMKKYPQKYFKVEVF